MRKLSMVVVLLGLVLAGCSKSKPSSTSAPSASVPASASARPTATPCTVAGASTLTASAPASGNEAAVRDIRYSDDGCPSIVFQFEGDHTPGYTVEYASPPFNDCGSGAPVAVSSWGADHYLQMRFEPSGGVDLSKSPNPTYTGPRDIAVDGPTLKHLKSTCDFEGVFTWIAGVRGNDAFKVQAMKDPPRIVVSISAAGA
jgi:hypothetical protein